ncbi:hypothetical protein [Micromonospora sp. NBRC 107095]|uniref:hypothetical protein n=1 Tax=Micromonospora TaxID=1873 RepID=UPI00249FAC51|nr:hypothetical protein [Micromonospora sp. NBRC 107095]GLZ61730.1 hypothetical protein Misp05_53060 [Micromonospora sp. NBRC 107095]
MEQRNERADWLAAAFDELSTASFQQVGEPDPDVPRRRAYRRLRNRVVSSGIAAAALVAVGGVSLIQPVATPPPTDVVAPSPATDLPTLQPDAVMNGPTSGSPTTPPSGSSTPSATASPSPTASRSASPRPTPKPTPTPTRYVDLSISAPRSLTLEASDTAYTGTLDVTMGNPGTRSYDAGDLIVVLPVEATISLKGTNIGGCFDQGRTDDLKTMTCTGDGPIPLGGTRSYQIAVTVNIAPGGPARTLTGFALTVRANVSGKFPADRSPGDNTAATTLQLPAS